MTFGMFMLPFHPPDRAVDDGIQPDEAGYFRSRKLLSREVIPTAERLGLEA